MAFIEGSWTFGTGKDNDANTVINNDTSIKFTEGLPGAFKLPTTWLAGNVNIQTTTIGVGNLIWNGGFDYTLINANTAFKITASDGAASDQFGYSVSVGSGLIVVGAPGDDDNGSSSGSAYIYDLNGSQFRKIKASDGAAGDNFGHSVAVGSNLTVVGSPGDDDKGNQSGSVYIFDQTGTQSSKITASDGAASDQFGYSVAVNSDRIVIGAPYDDDKGTDSGSVYIYRGTTLIKKITAPDGAAGDNFGHSVAINNGRIIVGAPYSDAQGTNSGCAYLFDLEGNYLSTITERGLTISLPLSSVVGSGTTTFTANINRSLTSLTPSVGDYIYLQCTTPTELTGYYKILSTPTSDSFTFQTAGNGARPAYTTTATIEGFRFTQSNILESLVTYGAPWSTVAGSKTITATITNEVSSDIYGFSTGTGSYTNDNAGGRIIPSVGQLIYIPVSPQVPNAVGTWRVKSVTSTTISFDVYEASPTTGTFSQGSRAIYFKNTPNHEFGHSVSIGSGRIAIGSPLKEYSLSNGDPLYGAVFLHDLNGSYCGMATGRNGFIPEGAQQVQNAVLANIGKTRTNVSTRISVPLMSGGSRMGHSVGVGSGYLVCGTPYMDIASQDSAGSAYLFSCKTTFAGFSSGTIYLYESTPAPVAYIDKNILSAYTNSATLFPSTSVAASDLFGSSVACGCDTIVIGAYQENNNRGVDAGAAYVFKIPETVHSNYEKILDAYGKDR